MKRFNAAISILGLLGLVLSGKTFAQDIDLERIVVMPSRIEESYSEVSRNIDVITSKDIEMSGAKDLAGVLTEITSVNISNYGGLGATKTIRMRGSTASQVLVLVDGRPINNPRDGQAELSNILLENIDRIEVMHGPGSSLYGAGAMGGTVNII
ncbi:MAG: TonB-dependent receptor plug domain-containing protein, partial [Candidatus Omnitrophica bacterium]|nr:TonB-dependent receptor plug domain-containing protein [Candidatus Omnitrophota bacterium]